MRVPLLSFMILDYLGMSQLTKGSAKGTCFGDLLGAALNAEILTCLTMWYLTNLFCSHDSPCFVFTGAETDWDFHRFSRR